MFGLSWTWVIAVVLCMLIVHECLATHFPIVKLIMVVIAVVVLLMALWQDFRAKRKTSGE